MTGPANGHEPTNAAGEPLVLVDEARHACSRLSPDEQAAYLGGTALALWPELAPRA